MLSHGHRNSSLSSFIDSIPNADFSSRSYQRSQVSQESYTRYADKVTNKMSNSSVQLEKRVRHLVSLSNALPLHHLLLALSHQSR